MKPGINGGSADMKERKHDTKQQNSEYDIRRWKPMPHPMTRRLAEPRRSNDYGHLIVQSWDDSYGRKFKK